MRRITGLLIVFLLLAPQLGADDGAASIAAGGIILMKREPRIVMARETLRINLTRVAVDYDFRNDSDEDITTGVAFPVPPYHYGDINEVFGDPGFDDFKLSIEGKPKSFQTEIRAFIGNREITALLAKEHIDAATFGHSQDAKEYRPSPDFDRANPASRQRLIATGAFTPDQFKQSYPEWRVEKKYFWTQTFPAHHVVHISHSYTPVVGGTNSITYGLSASSKSKDEDERLSAEELNSLCLEPKLRQSLLETTRKPGMRVPYNYVDFILTTANTWKTPIEDFTLIVERPPISKSIVSKPTASNRWDGNLVSFCWNGPIDKTDATHFMAHLTDFVPNKELRVGFLAIQHIDPEKY